MEEKEIMLKIENVSKVYKLGEIGGTTLRETFQRLWAKMRHKEDPTKKIGAKNYNKGEKFKALDNISFEVHKGERIGIIGHNGAGKSTLLKLISRVTGPTEGKIYLNGRVASMLEVGTGFNPELTGRENIYMNGAILGMTKKEIDSKIEDIIEFSEVRQFIDTPVKRYSSGMYVKLAFSVAAHLDSEIMIMDEVLAVGDMAFQNKCLNKMKEVSERDDKTILYVSHNMNTIRQLCDRVIVLNKGCIIYDGNVEAGIEKYMGVNFLKKKTYSFTDRNYDPDITSKIKITKVTLNNDSNDLLFGEKLHLLINYDSLINSESVVFRFTIYSKSGIIIGTAFTDKIICKGQTSYEGAFSIDISNLSPDDYVLKIVAIESTPLGTQVRHDCVNEAMFFSVSSSLGDIHNFEWIKIYWGMISFTNTIDAIRENENGQHN